LRADVRPRRTACDGDRDARADQVDAACWQNAAGHSQPIDRIRCQHDDIERLAIFDPPGSRDAATDSITTRRPDCRSYTPPSSSSTLRVAIEEMPVIVPLMGCPVTMFVVLFSRYTAAQWFDTPITAPSFSSMKKITP
jgi:hypothetical protein